MQNLEWLLELFLFEFLEFMKKVILRMFSMLLSFFARFYLNKTNPTVIGITGSVGKTSCRTIVSWVLKQFVLDKVVYTSPKNYNSEIGLPLSIFQIEDYTPNMISLVKVFIKIILLSLFTKPPYNIIVLEYWIDHPGDMNYLLKIVKPDISIFTKLDLIHLENFDSLVNIWEEKFKLLKNTKSLVYLNSMDDYCLRNHNEIWVEKRFFCSDHIQYRNYSFHEEKWHLIAEFKYENKNIKTNLLWEENASYITLWFDLLDYVTESNYRKLDEYFVFFEMQPGRFNIFNGINSSILIDSSYNAWPTSMKKMIENTINIREKAFPKYKLAAVIWDMRELWESSNKSHLELKDYLKDFDLVITVGPETKKYLWYKDAFFSSKEAWSELKKHLKKSKDKYIVLFKWSQNTIFVEEALKHVLDNKWDIKKLVRQEKYWLKRK